MIYRGLGRGYPERTQWFLEDWEGVYPERIEWFIKGQALSVVCFGSSPTPSPPLSLPLASLTGDTQKVWERETTCWGKSRTRGWARSRIIRPQESLILNKSFNTLWVTHPILKCPCLKCFFYQQYFTTLFYAFWCFSHEFVYNCL